MPGYRKRIGYKPRKSFKKRSSGSNWVGKAKSAAALAMSAWRGVQYLKGLVNAEKHKVDFSPVSGTINTSPTGACVSALATGDDELSRTANSVLTNYLLIKGKVQLHSSANFSQVRLVVVRDKQQIGDTSPTYTDVYESAGTQAFLNKNTVGRFDILYDRMCDLDSNNPQIIINHYIKLNQHVRFNGTASTDIQKGGIYFFAVSDQGTNLPTVGMSVRLAFYDN